MNNIIQTKFVGKNPFKKKVLAKEVDVSTIKITNDQPKKRNSQYYKYDDIFKDLNIGQSLSCRSEDCDKVAQALRNYVKRYNKPWKVRGMSFYTKTTGRVFVLEKV